MNLLDEIKKHRKGIEILLMIVECDRRLSSYEISFRAFGIEWYMERIEITIKVRERLTNYYNTRWK
jgi:hypothetical protein